MGSPRILVTGSRDWNDRAAISGALWEAWRDLGGARRILTLVHGACPTGADALADKVWRDYAPKHLVERHPARWRVDGVYDPAAGFKRNAEMVALGADVCLAFIGPCVKPRCKVAGPHGSHGASHAANLAENAGIPTRVYRG